MKEFLRGQISAAIAIATNARESVQREARIGARAEFTPAQQRRIEAALFAASAELVKAIQASNEAATDTTTVTTGEQETANA
jgi:hypothetical protein